MLSFPVVHAVRVIAGLDPVNLSVSMAPKMECPPRPASRCGRVAEFDERRFGSPFSMVSIMRISAMQE
jgi:hypothetical protein